MRKFKPAPKQASANRIRERYLHQLGLQRGGVAAASSSSHAAWNSNDTTLNTKHVVVISGLPSLPEDRATNGNVLESHDFSRGADGCGCSLEEGGGGANNHHHHVAIAVGGDATSHCSKSTLSTSPHGTISSYGGGGYSVADENMTSMALACPHSLLKRPHHHHHAMDNSTSSTAPANGNSGSSSALPFNLVWGTSQLSRSAAVLLDESRGGGMNDHDSVSSAVTASTAESSFTATMLSRDWGAAAPSSSATTTTAGACAVVNGLPTPSGTASVSSMGDSVTSAPGVFFQPPQRPSSYNTTTNNNNNNNCATSSSLAMALHRFNIDSDCEASIASNSIMEDPTTMMEEDDAASCASSHVSCGSSIASTTTSTSTKNLAKKKKKIGKNQRLLERANAQERMMHQKKMVRAGMVVQRGICSSASSSLVGLPVPLHLGGPTTTTTTTSVGCASSVRSCSSSVVSQASSIPLMHVDHQASSTTSSSLSKNTPVNASMCMSNGDTTSNVVVSLSPQELQQQQHPQEEQSAFLAPVVLPKRPSFGGGDLGRTPTASNCSQHTAAAAVTTKKMSSLPLPVGVYSNYFQGANSCRPLGYHPQLVSKIPTPPLSSSSLTNSHVHAASEMEVNVATVVPQVQGPTPLNQDRASAPPPPPTVEITKSVEDDVMEVAVTLSMLGNRTMTT